MSKIGILGTGSWGSALAISLASEGHEITMWSAIPDEIRQMSQTRRHPALGDAAIPQTVQLTTQMSEAVYGREILILAVPSIYTRGVARQLQPLYRKEQIVVNVAKGIEEETLKFLDEQIRDEIPEATVAVLSGPSHAEEVSRNIPTALVAACEDIEVARHLQEIFMSPTMRVYTSTDVRSVELGGALKNVIALAAGIADGLGYGDNTKAALITRGIHEMARLGAALGESAESLYGLTGIGDLIVTCASMHSRNRRAGILIGQGRTMQEAMNEVHMVVEGVYSARAAKALAEKYQVELPIVEEVNHVLFDGKNPKEAVDHLMTRSGKSEL